MFAVCRSGFKQGGELWLSPFLSAFLRSGCFSLDNNISIFRNQFRAKTFSPRTSEYYVSPKIACDFRPATAVKPQWNPTIIIVIQNLKTRAGFLTLMCWPKCIRSRPSRQNQRWALSGGGAGDGRWCDTSARWLPSKRPPFETTSTDCRDVLQPYSRGQNCILSQNMIFS